MYRVRLPEGEEAVFRTADELARAVASGTVSVKAKIYDPVGDLWLPIEWNPDYCAAVSAGRPAGSRALAAAPPPEATDGQWDDPAGSGRPAPAPVPLVAPPASRRLKLHRVAKWPKVAALLAAGVTAAGSLAIVVYLGLSRLLAVPPSPGGATAQSRLPPAGSVADSGPPPAESVEASSRSAGRATPARRSASYVESYAAARAELDDNLASVGFRQLFLPSRLLSAGGPHTVRRAVAAASNIVRVYRGREVMLEQSFRPGDSGPGSLRESFEAAEAARSLLAGCDSLFGVLEAQQGRYAFEGGLLRFQNPEAGRAYAALQGQITHVLRAWEDSTASRTQVILPRLLRAFRPPPPAGR